MGVQKQGGTYEKGHWDNTWRRHWLVAIGEKKNQAKPKNRQSPGSRGVVGRRFEKAEKGARDFSSFLSKPTREEKPEKQDFYNEQKSLKANTAGNESINKYGSTSWCSLINIQNFEERRGRGGDQKAYCNPSGEKLQGVTLLSFLMGGRDGKGLAIVPIIHKQSSSEGVDLGGEKNAT